MLYLGLTHGQVSALSLSHILSFLLTLSLAFIKLSELTQKLRKALEPQIHLPLTCTKMGLQFCTTSPRYRQPCILDLVCLFEPGPSRFPVETQALPQYLWNCACSALISLHNVLLKPAASDAVISQLKFPKVPSLLSDSVYLTPHTALSSWSSLRIGLRLEIPADSSYHLTSEESPKPTCDVRYPTCFL